MQRSFSFQNNVVTFQNLCFDENGLNEMVAKKKKRERERGGGGVVGIWVYGGRCGGYIGSSKKINFSR